MNIGNFYIDEYASDINQLFVDVQGRGTVVITQETNGIQIDIFPFHVVDEPIQTIFIET